ncbi:F-box protein SKIP22-like [Corylus avellana]|uniref:F-box protein SKIP22-like n=1 Tax=Corylus avellana TaxID=13451 RepID=UPI001E230727|nr:F-box protein SKIP22-like [Corylus avellana]
MGVDDGSVSMVKKFSERRFLRRVLGEEMGDYGGDHKLLVMAVNAVLWESGFVGFDSVTGMRVDPFHIADEWPSNAFLESLWYTLPDLLRHGYCNSGNMVESVVLKFQSLGNLVIIYGYLAKAGSMLYEVYLNENRFVPAISLAYSDEENAYPESEIIEFWKMVKDGLVLPLLIDLCEKANLPPPLCFMRLTGELKLKILKSLHCVDLARVGCVCSELRRLCSDNELWKRKNMMRALEEEQQKQHRDLLNGRVGLLRFGTVCNAYRILLNVMFGRFVKLMIK